MRRRAVCRPAKLHRKGAVAILAAVLLAVMLAMVAFAIDCGVLSLARGELQRGAHSAAFAAAWTAVEKANTSTDPFGTAARTAINAEALAYLAQHTVIGKTLTGQANPTNAPSGDVVIGIWNGSTRSFVASTTSQVNAVQVWAKRTSASNGEVPLFFGSIFGKASAATQTMAVAYFPSNIRGFKAPHDQSNLDILPITMKQASWDSLMAGNASGDNWRWDPSTGTVSPGQDGIGEAILYPSQAGAPGNFGTVNIGIGANSTSHLSQQIGSGVSPSDFAFHGGRLDVEAGLTLTGDTGLSASIESSLFAIVGQPRIIPIYGQLSGEGNNATFTIVGWGCVRIMDVQLNGNQKALIIQPCTIVTKGAIEGTSGSSKFVYAPPKLVM